MSQTVIEIDDPGGKRKPRRQRFIPLILGVCCALVFVYLAFNDSSSLSPAATLAKQALLSSPSYASIPLSPLEQEEEDGRMRMQEMLTEDKDSEVPTGYVRVPKIPRGPRTPDDGKLHIVFSSGCNYFQHWQSELVLASAKFVGQRGRITRIVSGCHDKSAESIAHQHQTFPGGRNDLLVSLKDLNRSVNEDFGLFITPSFDGARDFPWLNKPSSISYFVQHARKELDRLGEEIIVILDPDFVFLKPLSNTPLPLSDIIMSEPGKGGIDLTNNKQINVVIKGRPVAQQYGLGGQWVRRFNVTEIAGSTSPATKYTDESASKHFSVGPPLMLHVDDLTSLAPLWQKYMRPVLKKEVDILADMWAYCIAAAHLRLHHTTLDQYMISTWEGEEGQAYEWVDQFTELSCRDPQHAPHQRLPNFIHLASNFKAPESEEWMFHKGHVPARILECDSPLIKESPDNLWQVSQNREVKRQAWVLCHTVSILNRMLLESKEKFCDENFEKKKLVRLIQDKTKDLSCDEHQDKRCYPLAQIEDEL